MTISYKLLDPGAALLRLAGCLTWLLGSALVFLPLLAVAEARETVRLSGSSWVHDAPTRVAVLSGYFSGPGPEVVVKQANSGKTSLRHLLQGETEFALVAATPVALALLQQDFHKQPHDDDLVVLANISSSSQTHHVLALKDRDIHRPEDLRGRRVGLLSNSSAEYYWSQFSRFHGLQPGEVAVQELAIREMAEQLNSGAVDAVVTWDPWVFRLERDLSQPTVRFSERQIFTLNWLLVTRRKTVEQAPEVCERILKGYMRAVRTLHEQPSRARNLQGYDSDLPDAYLRAMEEKIIFHVGLQWSVLLDIEQQLDWLIAKHHLNAAARPRPEYYLAPGPLERLAPERVMMLNIWDDNSQKASP